MQIKTKTHIHIYQAISAKYLKINYSNMPRPYCVPAHVLSKCAVVYPVAHSELTLPLIRPLFPSTLRYLTLNYCWLSSTIFPEHSSVFHLPCCQPGPSCPLQRLQQPYLFTPSVLPFVIHVWKWTIHTFWPFSICILVGVFRLCFILIYYPICV